MQAKRSLRLKTSDLPLTRATLIRARLYNESISDIAKMPALAKVLQPYGLLDLEFRAPYLSRFWSVSIFASTRGNANPAVFRQRWRRPPRPPRLCPCSATADSFTYPAAAYRCAFQNLKSALDWSGGDGWVGISDIAISPNNPFVFYVGLGPWRRFQKRTTTAFSFEPIFDKQTDCSQIGTVRDWRHLIRM